MARTMSSDPALWLEADPASVPAARRWTAERLAGMDDETLEVAALLVTELVTNAIRHGIGPIGVSIAVHEQAIRVDVRDGDATRIPVRKGYGPEAGTGLGLELVSALATQWGVDTTDTGKAVWFELDRDAAGTVPRARAEPAVSRSALAAVDAVPGDEHDMADVQLLGLPMGLRYRSAAHQDALERELSLVASRRREGTPAVFAALVDALAGLRSRYARFFESPGPDGATRVVPSDVEGYVDVYVRLPIAAAEDVGRVAELLDAVDRHCGTGKDLLTLAAPPEVTAYRRWVAAELLRQAAGEPPTPWRQSAFAMATDPKRDIEFADQLPWSAGRSLLEAPDVALIVCDAMGFVLYWDDAAARLFGWSTVEARGRSLTSLLHLNGAHAPLLLGALQGQPLLARVGVGARDGTARDCTVFTTRRDDASGRTTLVGLAAPYRDELLDRRSRDVELELARLASDRAARAEAMELRAALERVQRLATKLAAAASLPRLAANVAIEALEVTGAFGAMVFELRKGSLELLAREGFPGEPPQSSCRIPLDARLPMAQAARVGAPVWVRSEAERDELYPALASTFTPRRSFAALPLTIEGRVIGVLGLAFSEERSFRGEDETLLGTLADLASQAILRTTIMDGERRARADAEGARQRLALIARAGAAVSSALDPVDLLRRLARLAVPDLGEWASVDLVEDGDDVVRRIAVVTEDAARTDVAAALERRTALRSPGAAAKAALAGGHAVVARNDPASVADDAEEQALLGALGSETIVVIPLVARGRRLGVLTVGRWDSTPPQPGDIELAEELGRRAAVGLDTVQLLREQTTVALTLQRSLLPPRLPEIPGIELAARYHPAGDRLEVGGDFYDVFPVGKQTWAVMVGDIAGKGPQAAALTALVRHTARAAARHRSRPAEVLAAVNDALLTLEDPEGFCTLAFAVVRSDPAAGTARLSLVSCGHPLPFRLRANGALDRVGAQAALLGVQPTLDIRLQSLTMHSGDALVLLTDGVLEARSESMRGAAMFGDEGVEDVLRVADRSDAGVIAEQVERAVLDFSGGKVADDMAILTLRVS